MPDERERPPCDRDQFGVADLGQCRLRVGWFGRLVVETLCERRDGSRFWRRARSGDTFKIE
jgi:hypothetical protein